MNDVFKALADPTRRRILELLREGDLSAGDIASAFDLGKPAISHHLAILREADLVQSERLGQSILYRLNTTIFQEVLSWIYGMKNDGGTTP